MELSPTTEGHVPFQAPTKTPCSTYYKVFGDLRSGTAPVVFIHGGPGAGHEYLLPFAALWPQYGIPAVFYDQLGCAASTHLRETAGDTGFWQESLFLAELANLLGHLQLHGGPGFHLYGHSWGARVAAAFAATRPPGLRRLVLASGSASTELADIGRQLRIRAMPPAVHDAIADAGRTGDTEAAAFTDALAALDRAYMYHGDIESCAELAPSWRHLADDQTVNSTLFGTTIYWGTKGSMADWTVIPRLPLITAETLVYSADNDTTHDVETVPFFELIPRVRWVTFPNCSHMCHVDAASRDRVFKTVGDFLSRTSASAA